MERKELQSKFVDADYSVTQKAFYEKMSQGNMDYLQGMQDALNYYFCELSEASGMTSFSAGAEIAMNMYRDLSMTYMHMTKYLADMESRAHQFENDCYNESADRRTPCDYPDNDGHYNCPFDAQGGDDCRNFCGLGVDE